MPQEHEHAPKIYIYIKMKSQEHEQDVAKPVWPVLAVFFICCPSLTQWVPMMPLPENDPTTPNPSLASQPFQSGEAEASTTGVNDLHLRAEAWDIAKSRWRSATRHPLQHAAASRGRGSDQKSRTSVPTRSEGCDSLLLTSK